MDEKSGDAGDDQGSGWLQVKKKHRSNSKFSLQGWVGGFSKKPNSNESDLQSNNCDTPNNSHVPTKVENSVNYLDKCVVSHVDDHHKTDNVEVFPKIKWGNLDDIEIKFGDIGKTEVIEDDTFSNTNKPHSNEPKEKEITPIVEEKEEEDATKSIEIEEVKVEFLNERVVSQSQSQSDGIPQEVDKNLESENLEASEMPKESTTPINPSEEDSNIMKQNASNFKEFPGVQIMSEIEGGESKERFRQRLWCFLFENLNRAVDELYLLCELECDKDQMKEAVLVLEEAASDFKELNCRVEEFEKVKKSTGQTSDSLTMTMKSEQRRPHALSWEVRRMTTSPHRAEILSSSLEAFKKIQQERAAMNNNNNNSHKPDHRSTRNNSVLNKHTSKTTSADRGKNKKETTTITSAETEKTTKKQQTFIKSMDAWKQKRNWEDILTINSGRRSTDRARTLHDKLMSPDKKKKTLTDLKKEAEEKHARATRIRNELEHERLQKLQKITKKSNRVNEWQTIRTLRLREGMQSRHQRSETRHEAYLAQVARRAGDESTKVNEVRFITSLTEENRKLMLLKKYQDSEMRKLEKLKDMKSKQKEETAKEEAVLERKKLVEAEKLQKLAETQRKKEEAVLRREEERKASSLAREAKAMDQMRRREVLAKAQQEEAELLAQKLVEKLRESEQRRKFYLEQIRERASMDFRDQTSPLLRRSLNVLESGGLEVNGGGEKSSSLVESGLKRRIKKIRQRLMALKYESNEVISGGERAAVGTARAKIGRWLQELQRHRQARKEGAASIGLVTADIIKFLDGKDPELHASRQAGLLDFIASALPASHTSKPEASQVTIYFLRLLRVILSLPANRTYFLASNLLPPMIPMLSAALENFIKITASSSSSSSSSNNKTLIENSDTISEVLDGSLFIVSTIIGHSNSDERQVQMQDGLIELVIAYQVIHRLRDLFALYDRPQVEGSPFPSSILLSIDLLVKLSSRYCGVSSSSSIDWESNSKFLEDVPEDRPLDDLRNKEEKNRNNNNNNNNSKPAYNYKCYKQPVAYLLLAISETGLVCLPSLLTAVLLQANNNRLSSEQGSYVLPSNFEEVATGVLKVLNNLALIDINFIQMMLARPDLKMEFFHLMSYLLSHCTAKWGVATDQTGLLLLESLLLLGYFAMFHPENQAVLRWGKSPTILHKVCDLPFVFFSDPELMPVLAGTLVAACFGSEQNKGVVQQELSIEMLLSLLKSCKTESTQSAGPESTQSAGPESRKVQERSNRRTSPRVQAGKSNRSVKIRSQKDNGKSLKVCESSLESCSNLMLHSRFPASFVDRAELFFSTESSV